MIDYVDIIHTISISLLHSLYSLKENVIHILKTSTKEAYFRNINEIKM